MTRNSARLSLLVAAILFFSSALPIPAPAQTVSFIAGSDFAAGTNPHFVAVGDFNGDGKLDLAVADAGSATDWGLTGNGAGSVLLGKGDGAVLRGRRFIVGRNHTCVAVEEVMSDD